MATWTVDDMSLCCTLDGRPENGAEKAVIESALTNPVILERIFALFPTRSLLNCCSLVNKLWRFEARSFIRERRRCYLPLHLRNSEEQMMEIKGRIGVLPFNGILIRTKPDPSNLASLTCNCCPPASIPQKSKPEQDFWGLFESSFGQMTIKHLLIMRTGEIREFCVIVQLLLRLFRDKKWSLISLKFVSIPASLIAILASVHNARVPGLLELPNLEELDWGYTPKWEGHRNLLLHIVESAPRLRKILNSGGFHEIFRILPKDKHRLVTDFRLHVDSQVVKKMVCEFAAGNPSLCWLETIFPRQGPAVKYAEAAYQSLQPLLQSSFKSLKFLRIYGHWSLHELTFPPLLNLNTLRLMHWTAPGLSYMHALKLLQFGRLFPALKEVMLYVNEWNKEEEILVETNGKMVDFENNEQYTSKSVSNLWIYLDFSNMDLTELKRIFPALISISFICKNVAAVPLTRIFQLWPALVRLVVHGRWGGRNYDDEFSRIHPEEAGYLRGQDEAYLKAVQIVPTQPSIWSMRDLIYVEIGVYYDPREQSVATDIVHRILHGPVPLENVPEFMSQVAQLVAFKKFRSSIREKDRGWDYFFEI